MVSSINHDREGSMLLWDPPTQVLYLQSLHKTILSYKLKCKVVNHFNEYNYRTCTTRKQVYIDMNLLDCGWARSSSRVGVVLTMCSWLHMKVGNHVLCQLLHAHSTFNYESRIGRYYQYCLGMICDSYSRAHGIQLQILSNVVRLDNYGPMLLWPICTRPHEVVTKAIPMVFMVNSTHLGQRHQCYPCIDHFIGFKMHKGRCT